MSKRFMVLTLVAALVFSLGLSNALAGKPPKNVAPTVTAFEVPPSSESPIPINVFTATDPEGPVTGYMVTETATPPGAGDSRWEDPRPASYTTSSTGLVDLFAWAKDEEGAVSDPFVRTVDIPIPPDPLEGRVAALEAAVALLQSENANQQGEINVLVSENAAQAADIINLQADVQNLQVENGNQQIQIDDMQIRLAAVETNTVLQLDGLVRVDPFSIQSLSGPHVIFEGANVHVRNAMGATPAIDGLGNLIIGHNEEGGMMYGRMGSHNLVVGMMHSYTAHGGLVAGEGNAVMGPASSVTGGSFNEANGFTSSISGGDGNRAMGFSASISGGTNNMAMGNGASVSGGEGNHADGEMSSIGGGSWNGAMGWAATVTGGDSNQANADRSSILGGHMNITDPPGMYSSVSGGTNNTTGGMAASITGGEWNNAFGMSASVTGGMYNHAAGPTSSVSGGDNNIASGPNATVTGGSGNQAFGMSSSVSGGQMRIVDFDFLWVGGALLDPQ